MRWLRSEPHSGRDRLWSRPKRSVFLVGCVNGQLPPDQEATPAERRVETLAERRARQREAAAYRLTIKLQQHAEREAASSARRS